MDLAIFYFYFSAASKNRKGEGREKAFSAGYIYFTSMISKRKEKALISLTVHDSKREGGGLASLERAEVLMYSYY